MIEKYIEKTRVLTAKIVPTDWSVGLGRIGRIDHFFGKNSKTPKNFLKCLIFNGLLFWSGFGVALEWLWSFVQFYKKDVITKL